MRSDQYVMAEPLKNQLLTPTSLAQFADTLQQHDPAFDKARFLTLIFDQTWERKELKARMRHVTLCLHDVLPSVYAEALDILIQAAPQVKGFEGMCLPDYVELYGMDDWERSLPALGHFTKFASSEFAIRPFLDADPDRAMVSMLQWAEDADERVRRFASEGCRPRLPWAMALPKFKKDPSLILPVLEKLKADDSEFVRKSVANNLNDISKDHPDLLLEIAERWYGHHEHTDWIVKHACRSLLKAGNPRALAIFGHSTTANLSVESFQLARSSLRIGETLNFSFVLNVQEPEPTNVRLEYAVYYVKANGQHSRKIFKINEKMYAPGKHEVFWKQAFVQQTTRKHYPGQHQIAIVANGEEKARLAVELQPSAE